MESEYRIEFSEAAISDLVSAYDAILRVSGFVPTAEKWYSSIMLRIRSLRVNPNGHLPYLYDGRYRTIHFEKYKIVYGVDEATRSVVVMRVVYARRNLEALVI